MNKPARLSRSALQIILTQTILLIGILCCASSIAFSQADSTLAAETGNNTSASENFRGMADGNAPAGPVSKVSIHKLLYQGNTTRIYARLMPFFGDKSHVSIGYDSTDRGQIARQVADMISRGIDGAILDWYGPERGRSDQIASMLRDEAERHDGFEFALSEDHGALENCAKHPGCDVTQRLITDLNYAYEHFERSPAYMRQNVRPVMMFFDVEAKGIDWSRVRQEVAGHPLFVFRNSGAFSLQQSDGGYAWIGDAKEGGNGMPYLQRFYKASLRGKQQGTVLTMGSAYKGFNDSAASWGKHRLLKQDCGKIWLETFAQANQIFSRDNPLDALQIVTWNDYEEGTEVESGIENCVQISASLSGKTLHWKISGDENTVDHYTVWASRDGKNISRVADLPVKTHSIELDSYPNLTNGNFVLYVEAIGKPCMTNHMSNGISNGSAQ